MKKYGFLLIIISTLFIQFSFGQSIITNAASSVNTSAATLNGTANPEGAPSDLMYSISFDWGPTTSYEYGNVAASPNSATSNGTTCSLTIDTLRSNVQYHYRILADTIGAKAYGTDVSFTTNAPTAPTVTTSAATNIAQTTATFNGEVTADGGASITARGVCYSTSTAPTTSGSHTTGGTTVDSYSHGVTGLTAGTKYYIRAYATNSAGPSYGSETDFTTLKNAPTAQASGVTFTDVASTTMTVSWTRAGAGGGEYCLVVAEAGTGAQVNSPSEGTDYTASSAFGSGTPAISGTGTSYAIFKGTGTTVDVTGLTAGESYTFKVFEFNNTGANTKYFVSDGTNNPKDTTTLSGEPSTQATTITFSSIQTNQLTATASGGNGSYRIILTKQGSAVNGIPADGTEYTGNSSFGSGAQIGTGNYIVSAGSSSAVTVTGLSENTRYYFKVFEYNNTGSNTNYKTDGFGSNNPNDTITTKPTPTTQPSNLTFSNIQTDRLNLSWTRGNGDSVLVLAIAGSSISDAPLDNNVYTPNAAFGSGDNINSSYVVYTGTGTGVTITALSSSAEYTFKAFEFNNSYPYTDYLTTGNGNAASQYTVGTAPTTQATDIIFPNIQSSQVAISFTAGIGGGNRLVLARQGANPTFDPVDGFAYTANGSFTNGDEIGTGNYVVYNGSGTGVTVTNLLAGTTYHFKVYEYSGTGTAVNYLTSDGASNNPNSQTTAAGKPTKQACNLNVTGLNTTQYTVNWTRGGGDSIMVVGKAGSTLSETPTDQTDYTADANFGDGDQIATGCNVVYKGEGSSVTITNLTQGANYTFKAFEYNSVSNSPYYLDKDTTNNPYSRYTLATEPSGQASGVSTDNIAATQLDLSWTAGAGGGNRIVLAHEINAVDANPIDGTGYTANNSFGSGDEIGTGNYVVYSGSGIGATITNLEQNTTYHFKVYEYGGTATSSNYLTTGSGNTHDTTTIKDEPTTQANTIAFTNIATITYTTGWARGNGDSVLIVARQGSAVTNVPQDGTTYTANAAFGTVGTTLGSGYVVYNGPGTTENITALLTGTEYHFRAFEYTNTGADIDYLTTTDVPNNNPNSQYTLDNEPTTQVTSFTTGTIGSNNIPLSWTVGNGTGRIVLAKQGSAVSATPVDATNYTANATFGSGDEIGTGNFVVYSTTGTGTSVDVTGLLGSTNYHFQIFEYNDNGAINYRTSDGPTANAKTGEKSAPTVQASVINFTNFNTTSFTINWTKGNGELRIVTMKEATTGSPTPTNNITYAASTDWGNKTGLVSDGFYTICNGNDTTVSITNVSANTTYRVQIFEYNNTNGAEKYFTATATDNPKNQTTLKIAPTTQAFAISLTNKTSTSFTVNCTNGNGDNRIIVARASGTSNVTPTDLTDYSADAEFGSGDPTGTGNYVVYNGTSSTVAVSGLTASTSYTFVVYDYNNSSTSATFNTTLTDDANYKDSTTLGPVTWDGSTDTDWNTADNWTPSGVPTSSYSVTIADVTNQPVVGANHSVEHLTVNAGAWLTINNGNTLTVIGNVTLKSPSGNGAAGQVVISGTGVLSVSGSSTMERYYPSTANWRLVSSPITSPSITDWNGYYVNAYNEPNVGWDYLNSNSTIAVMQGVSVKNSSGTATISFNGTFNSNNKSINVTNSSTGDDSYGWNLVGNPYPSAIDWGAQTGITRTDVDAAAYLYDTGSGSYTTITTSGVIAAGQGFFVHAGNNGSLAFTNAARTASTQSFRKNITVEHQSIKLIAKNDYYTTEAIVMFDDNATSEFDGEYDAFKLMSTNDTISDIYSVISSGTILSINTLNTNALTTLSEQELIIPIGLTPGNSGIITLSAFSIENISESIYVYLFDIQEDKYINLREDMYEVFIETKTDDRFQLILSQTALNINNSEILNNNILIYTYKNTTFVKSDIFKLNTGNIYIYDITGKLIHSKATINSSVQEIYINKPGTYIIKVIIDNYVVTQKVVVR